MKSSMEIAKDIGVSPQEIHKRLSPEFMRQFKDNCIEEKDGCMYFDSEVEDLLKLLFNKKQEDITTNWFYNDEDIALQKNAAENNLPIKNPESTSEAIEPKAYDDSQLDEIPYINNISQPLYYRDDVLTRLIEKQQDEISRQLEWCDRQIHQLIYKQKIK